MKIGIILTIASLLPAVAWAATKEVHVTVNGMVCGFCAQGITKKFSKESAIEKVEVNLGQKKVDLALRAGSEISDEKIQQVLTEAGYSVQRIERN